MRLTTVVVKCCWTNACQVSHPGPTIPKFHGFHQPQVAMDEPVSFTAAIIPGNNFLADIWVLSPQGPSLNTLRTASPSCGYREPFITFTPFCIHSFLSPTHLWACLFNLYRDSSKTESEPFPETKSRLFFCSRPWMHRIENQHLRALDFLPPRPHTLTLIYQHLRSPEH